MKLTGKILLGLMTLLLCSIFISAIAFKNIYEKNDKGELYFTYGIILQEPFSHLVVNGGNVSTIIYEPAAKPSVRVYKRWNGYIEHRIKAAVRNDTLYLDFPGNYKDVYEQRQLKYQPMVRLFSPQLKSVKGSNTNLQLLKLRERNLVADISGHSGFEVESLIYNFNDLLLKASDSTEMIFEISPALKKRPTGSGKIISNEIPGTVRGWDAFYINRLKATISGTSFIDVGHAQIDSIQMHVSDTSAIILSGGTIKKLHLDPSVFSY